MINILAIVEILIAGYLFYAAISGKSKVFESVYVKKGKEADYKKTGRIGYAAIGGLVLVLGIVNLIASILALEGAKEALLSTLGDISNVFMWLALTSLLVLYVLFMRLQDKEKKNAPARSTAPRAAFFFDEEERQQPPVPQKQQRKKGK